MVQLSCRANYFFDTGIPNLRLRLPSRNWLIFLSLSTTLTSAILYDRREKKRATQRWAESVSHVAAEPLRTDTMPRRITVYVASPPGDGGSLRAGRELFHEYVRPVLMAGGMDWDVVEGRREGNVREALAGRVRRYRRRKGGEKLALERNGAGNQRLKQAVAGEQEQEQEKEQDPEEEFRLMREGIGIKEWEGVAGDIIIGRHTWKEYVRGLHEGWLGPLEAPRKIDGDDETALISNAAAVPTATSAGDDASPTSTTLLPSSSSLKTSTSTETATTSTSTTNSKTSTQSQPEKVKPRQRPSLPYIHPSDYAEAPLPTTISTDLGPSTTLPFPHILGFLNTPIRLKRFLMRRRLADEIGREVAGVVLGLSGEFERMAGTAATVTATSYFPPTVRSRDDGDDDASPVSTTTSQVTSGLDVDTEQERKSARSSTTEWEQAHLLEHEEADWPSAFRRKKYGSDEDVDMNKKGDGDGSKESVWVDGIVLDDRIAGRMRRFVSESRISGDGPNER